MPTLLPSAAVASVLAAGLPAEYVDVNTPTDLPDRGIWCLPTGGFAPIPEQGTGLSWERPTVQVICRGEVGQAGAIEQLAHDARRAINKTPPEGYTDALPQGGVIMMAPDKKGRPRASFNVVLTILE